MNLKKVGSTNSIINPSPSKVIKGTKNIKENGNFEATLGKDKKVG